MSPRASPCQIPNHTQCYFSWRKILCRRFHHAVLRRPPREYILGLVPKFGFHNFWDLRRGVLCMGTLKDVPMVDEAAELSSQHQRPNNGGCLFLPDLLLSRFLRFTGYSCIRAVHICDSVSAIQKEYPPRHVELVEVLAASGGCGICISTKSYDSNIHIHCGFYLGSDSQL